MDYLDFELKDFNDDKGTFEGLGAIFGTEDQGGDVIKRGAFKRTIEHNGGEFPLLWQHSPSDPIGLSHAEEKRKHVLVKGVLDLDIQRGQDARSLMKKKIVKGMSFGFDILKHMFEGQTRHLQELKLWEFSVVTFPMHPDAQITTVKSVSPFKDLKIASRGTDWDASEAEKRVREWAGAKDGLGDSEVQDKYKQCFVWHDADDPDDFDSYKLLIADIVDGEKQVIPRGVFAAAAVVQNARGVLDVSDAEATCIRKHLGSYYDKLDMTPPWGKTMHIEAVLAQTIGYAEMAKINEAIKCDPEIARMAGESLIALSKTLAGRVDPEVLHSTPEKPRFARPAGSEEAKADSRLSDMRKKLAGAF